MSHNSYTLPVPRVGEKVSVTLRSGAAFEGMVVDYNLYALQIAFGKTMFTRILLNEVAAISIHVEPDLLDDVALGLEDIDRENESPVAEVLRFSEQRNLFLEDNNSKNTNDNLNL